MLPGGTFSLGQLISVNSFWGVNNSSKESEAEKTAGVEKKGLPSVWIFSFMAY